MQQDRTCEVEHSKSSLRKNVQPKPLVEDVQPKSSVGEDVQPNKITKRGGYEAFSTYHHG